MMLTIISCCLTGILGFFTYKLTKAAEDIKAENRKAKQALSAYKLLLNIKHNSYIIYKYYRNLGTLQGLQCNINLVEDWLNLYYAKIIDEEEKNFFMAHNSYVRNLYDSDENNDGTRSKDLAQKYYSAYLTQDEGVFEFNKNVKNIIQKLESISEGEIVNVPETK